MYAAAKLKIHRNTLLYRVARINELIHLDDMEYIKSQRLLMSMQLERIKEKKGKKL
ncbi:helix-turn-helix domain-containing protein [bacterium]|nr:helix-turn-helix domain-containing protein [bacterium]